MTDLHTHILPGMDDGAKNADESLALLRMEREQGVSTVVLTPHYYRTKESVADFLARRRNAVEVLEARIRELPEEEQAALPRRLPGAEVAWTPDLPECDDLRSLCLGETETLLLELPFTPWDERMIRQLYNLMSRTGVMPVIAHLERYLRLQKKQHIREILDMGLPVQISTDALMRFTARGAAMKLLKNRRAHLLASDCHRVDLRPPYMKEAMELVAKKLGQERVDDLLYYADELIGL